ncbi:4-hydroxythreonine-4-phosphate dehydrogenase PdxA [Fulvivirga sediminis]|uniref:4-hydroxythreonine-4-phosphate dehydrogenase PdxA n=1 Tax=Fulvivirga sediminis TaxID=2803949 RepID=A0A937JYG7_9BACT|nr:4-hydroxythreonine-4-phosphate dehydrogenase PdxA [Fulvivirga sediminis]MBL3656408.1 4-hydroxythreonine-4-phosphate dehydrogenase PdxA [Fulvivirga sediminis]
MSNHSKHQDKPRIGITIGDINGIGPEVIIKSLRDNRLLNYLTPVIYGSSKVLSFYKKTLKYEDFNFTQIKDDGKFQNRKINVVNCWNEMIEINTGEVTEGGGKSSFLALEKATQHLKQGLIDAIVTAPINKNNIQNDQFKFAGHTEYFTQKFGAKESLMFMATDNLKIGVVTGHLPLKDVSKKLTKELITQKLNIMESSLRNDFGIQKPKIALLGLNPHAGENGLLGKEDDHVIKPVINQFKSAGKLVFGPYPADGFFGKNDYTKFDAVLAMYHDQGLIPFKTLAFENGVNFTAGLPVIRTSPDHGTAYDIAGKNIASESSMLQAIYMAKDIYDNHNKDKEYSDPSSADG